jgi:hypothetical protein
MIKQIALLKTKPGMTYDAFVKRYEQGHVPLINKLLPYFHEYRRSYIIPGSMVALAHVGDAAPEPAFNVVTELWFDDQSKVDMMSRCIVETDAGKLIAQDETALFDRTQMVMFAGEEHVTPAGKLQPRPPGHQGRPAVKQIALLRAKPGMSRDAFIAYYENNHAVLAMRLLAKNGKCIFAEYSRTYPLPGGGFDLSHVEHAPAAIDFDVLREFWFWTKEDYELFLKQCADPKIGSALTADEENFFDRRKARIFLTEEHITPL